ncbi:MAG: hypothetical protein ACLQVJ_27125, partial [Syntrophobacteraceae bacterium]
METVSQKFPHVSMMFPGSFHLFPCGERDQGHRQGAASQKIGRELGTHKRSCPDSKHWPAVTMRSPDLN